MAKGLKSYRDWLGSKLADPERASRYLNSAAEDSEAMFLKALRKVAMSQARPMAEIAEACDVSRESLYRMLSENGNPTSENRRAILAALGLKSIVVPIGTHLTITGLSSQTPEHTAISSSKELQENTVSGKAEMVLISCGHVVPSFQALKKPVASTAILNASAAGFSIVSEMSGAR